MPSLADLIQNKIREAFAPEHLILSNESTRHKMAAGPESHFKLVIVSKKFSGLRLLDRHKLVHDLLAPELKVGIHALNLKLYSPEEWHMSHGSAPKNPPRVGGLRF